MGKNIALLCMAGMSTSMLVNKMKEVSIGNDEVGEIEAYSVDDFERIIDKYDCFLLGPQIRYKLPALTPIAQAKNKPIEVIDMLAYGTVNGKSVVEQALKMV